MGNVTIQSRISAELKHEAEAIFSSMGLSTSDAIRLFLQQSVNVGGLPFQPMARIPNAVTRQAIEDADAGRLTRRTFQDFATSLEHDT